MKRFAPLLLACSFACDPGYELPDDTDDAAGYDPDMNQPSAPEGLSGDAAVRIGDTDFEATPDKLHIAKPASQRTVTFPPISTVENGARVQVSNLGTADLVFTFTHDGINDFAPPITTPPLTAGQNTSFVAVASDGTNPATWAQLD